MRNCWWAFFRWSLKTNIKCCFYTVTTFCFSFLATLTKAKHFNHRNNLMINTWTKVCLGKTILCVQTQRKGWWWQRSTIFLSLPLLLFFLVMIVKKAKKKATPKTADYQPLLFFSEVSIVWHKTIFRETKWKATNENRVWVSFVGYHSLPRRKMQSMRNMWKTKQGKKCFLSWRTSSTKLYQIK